MGGEIGEAAEMDGEIDADHRCREIIRQERATGLVGELLGVAGVAMGLMSDAGDASESATMVSGSAGFPVRVTSTPATVWLQVAVPPVRTEQLKTLAGSGGSSRVVVVGFRRCR